MPCCFNKLLKEAHRNNNSDENVNSLSKENWIKKREAESSLFQFWRLCIRGWSWSNSSVFLRGRIWADTIFFCLVNNNVHYAILFQLHLQDMISLTNIHPGMAVEFFRSGKCVIRKFVVLKSRLVLSAFTIINYS